jgi:uncharacterized protein YrzB (UPF0473 family)
MAEEELTYVDLSDEDGNTTKCEVYDVIDYEGKTYALLLPLEDEDDSEEAELIVLEYVEDGDEGQFISIDDEDEFNRVCEYIESLENEDEDEE